MKKARSFVVSSLALLLCAPSVTAQATFTPSYNAPYRAFVHHEFGLGLGADFRVGRLLDLRVSGGLFDGPEGVAVSLVWIR